MCVCARAFLFLVFFGTILNGKNGTMGHLFFLVPRTPKDMFWGPFMMGHWSGSASSHLTFTWNPVHVAYLRYLSVLES